MRVLLVPSFNVVDSRVEPYVPYGLLALQAAASDLEGISVHIARPSDALLDYRLTSSDELVERVLAEIDIQSFDIFGVSVVCNSAHYSLDLANRLKQLAPSRLLIAGGPYVTKLAAPLLKAFPSLDGIFVGEAEIGFRALLKARGSGRRSLFGIPGLVTREGHHGAPPPIHDLDELPAITQAADYLAWLSLVRQRVPDGSAAPLEATRGCPLKCSFCSTKQVWGPEVRRKSATRLISEMSHISRSTGDIFFSLIGDNVGVPRNPFMAFCEQLKSHENPYLWGCSLKLDRLSESNLETMWNSGCRAMFVGLESASQRTLSYVNKTANLETELNMVRKAIDMGFEVETSFIIGFPWETEGDVRATFQLHCDLLKYGANRSQVGILCPIPGTEIVQGHEVVFDGWRSYVAQDDVKTSVRHAKFVEEFPTLFSHFGHYRTPDLPKTILKAFRDAAGQVAQIHVRNRKSKLSTKQQNHGRTPDIRSQVYI